MRSRSTFLLAGMLCILASVAHAEAPEGLIARTYEDGNPVIIKVVDELPPAAARKALGWLVVVSWEYEGSDNNGMPSEQTLQRMIALEGTIRERLERDGFLRHAYSRTGNNLKELVYYAHDRDAFLEALNEALADHEEYPIEIEFQRARDWKELKRLLADISGSG